MKRYIIGLLMLFASWNAFGQLAPDTMSVIKKIGYYNRKLPSEVLFAHFDKTIYTNNENVWFTAYLLNSAWHKGSSVLSIVLMNDDDRTMVMEKKFVMADNIALGNLSIPDSLLTGNYTFLLYTDYVINGNPADIFRQPITIKNTNNTSFTAFMDLLDTAANQLTGSRRVRLLTSNKGIKLVAGATVNYRLGDAKNITFAGKAITDKAGQYQFNIPVKDIKSGSDRLQAKITYNKEVQLVSLNLPVAPVQPIVKFYPEGGNLTVNLSCNVGWEVRNANGDTYRLKAILQKDNITIDTIETNSLGVGRFWLNAQNGHRYSVRLLNYGKDTAYYLPVAVNNVPRITIPHALCYDTLTAFIKTIGQAKIYALLHNYRQTFALQQLNVSNSGTSLKMALDEVPKGVIAITLLNEQMQPFAERLFFAHYNQRVALSVTTDSGVYRKRELVKLRLRLPVLGKDSLNGLVSVACVQAGRQQSLKSANIMSYLYLEHELNVEANDRSNQAFDGDETQLENILLIKGWRRYKWTDMMRTLPADTINSADDMRFKGEVLMYGKKPKKDGSLMIMQNNRLSMINTRAGSFTLSDSNLLVSDNKKLYMYVSGATTGQYAITLADPFTTVNRHLADLFIPVNYHTDNKAVNYDNDLNSIEHATQLREVKVKDRANSMDQSHFNGIGVNECGDYVCQYNILNCPNHKYSMSNKLPIVGQMYFIDGAMRPYTGCYLQGKSMAINEFDGINYAMEFYGSDYSKVSPLAPEYNSTIFWKHLCKVSSTNYTELSFYTSDVTGNFKIVVQGIIPGDVIYAEKNIRITAK